jgi:hypothetical protein
MELLMKGRKSKRRAAIQRMVVEGARASTLNTIWLSDDLALMREAMRRLPTVTPYWKAKFQSALKQTS